MNYQETFKSGRLFLIAGPCVLEGREEALRNAEALKKICEEIPISLVWKSSYDKANRSSYDSFRGPGLELGLKILGEVKKEFDLPICTDFHGVAEAHIVAEIADVLQVPAFLARQTDMLVAAGLTGKVVQIKRGQFLSYPHMSLAAEKVRITGNNQIILTERGSSFGHGDLVVDFRGLQIMAETGYSVCFDAGHSTQQPVGNVTTDGQRRFIPALARAAVAVGVGGVFLECHLDPINAKSDSKTQYPMNKLKELLMSLVEIHALRRGRTDENSFS